MRILLAVVAALAVGCGAVKDDECLDGDADGVCFRDDSDDGNPFCGGDPTDDDADGRCAGFDCDDSAATGATCFEGCVTGYPDADGDGYGDMARPAQACTLPAGLVADGTDCDDTPGTGQLVTPVDYDGDGSTICDDCDDDDPAIHPGAAELCDGIDNDCNAATDENGGDPDGDGVFGCADSCPMLANGISPPTQIIWEFFETNTPMCGCATTTPVPTGVYHFTLNGTEVAIKAGTSPSCSCAPPVQSITSDATGWVTGMNNQLGFTVAQGATGSNDLIGWVRARLVTPDGEVISCLYDHNGGDCTATDLCGGTFCDANAVCSTYQACPVDQFTAPVHRADRDGDGAGADCDCDDANTARTPDKLELCTNGIDDDCDGKADAMDDECAACNRTVLSEAGKCADALDNDCDGLLDTADPDCAGVACAQPAVIALARDGTEHETRSGTFDLCAMGPSDTTTQVCSTAESQPDYWQKVTVHDPLNQGYRVQVCFNGLAGEVLTNDTFGCAVGDLDCAKVFMMTSNNCYIDPASGSFTGTRTFPLVFRSAPDCTKAQPSVNWQLTLLPP